MIDARKEMGRLMHQTIHDEAAHHDWVYSASRPEYVPHSWHPGQRVVADCSKGSQYIAHWAGAPDPFGRHFDPYGNSSSACAHLPHLDHASELQVGDYVTFGYYGDEHMACVMEAGSDPVLWSHGHPGAPNSYHLSADGRTHQLLHNPVHPVPETPQEKLRAKTGFWAWYQWNRGLGHWHKYGKKNKNVRPNVPRRIPLRWWRRRARLILLRRKRRANRKQH